MGLSTSGQYRILKAKHEIELKDLKLKHEAEVKAINLKLESTEKELRVYKEVEKLQLSSKLAATELKLGKITSDKAAARIEELKKLEMSELKEKYTLVLEELTEKSARMQGRLPTGDQSGGTNLKFEDELVKLKIPSVIFTEGRGE